MLYLASDHSGFDLKQQLKTYLSEQGIVYEDVGAKELIPADDYPDYAKLLAEKVLQSPQEHMGIAMCRSGGGMTIVLNKFKGIWAIQAWKKELAYAGRNDDVANVLVFGSDYITLDVAREAVHVFLDTPPSREEKHIRRVGKVIAIENTNFK